MIKERLRVNLVSGGAGFIGSHLIDSLMLSGEKVICLDNFSNGTLKNISKWLGNENFHYEDFDICNKYYKNVDRIWHLASLASPKQYLLDPISTTKSCFIGSYNMLELARKCNARILLTSSSEIYGDCDSSLIYEENSGNVNCFSKRACYSEGKRISETLFFNYKDFHNVDIRIARIFNTYGPRLLPNDGRVIPNFLNQIFNDKPLEIYGDGSQTRCFCYVTDMVKALISLMDSDYYYPINIGSDREISIRELAFLISKKLEKPFNTIISKKLLGDPMHRKPSIQKAINYLKWKPEVTLEEGLDILITKILNK